MRREFAIGFALALIFGGCVSAPVDLGPQSSSAAVSATKMAEARNPGSGRAVELCCFTISWTFKDDGEPPIAAGEKIEFRISIDGTERPQFAQSRILASAQHLAEVRFVTVIPADLFFGHQLQASLVRASHINAMGEPTLVNGFTKGSAL